MYKNQYYITNLKLDNPKELKSVSYNNLNVYFHPSIKMSIAKNESIEILLLGYIINPFKPLESNDDIVKYIAEVCSSKEILYKELQSLSGRFTLLYKNDSDFIALNDADALKQLYYGFINKNIILTSSPRMFLDLYGGNLQISDIKQEFINLQEYEPNEHAWFGDKCIDDRLIKVLPNHFLDIINKNVHRIPIYFDKLVNETDIIEYSADLLRGSMSAITKRYEVIQPITAGWDSRTLLAASKECVKDIKYYVIDFSIGDKKMPDVWVPQNLSKKLGINFQVIKLKEPSNQFLTMFKREHVNPRLQYVSELEYLYDNYVNRNVIRVSGIAGATLKAVYGYTNHEINADILHHFTYYMGKSEFIRNEVTYWVNDAKEYAKEYSIPLLDLFHWENKVGNWGALTLFEQDIAIEDFCPHANRNLIASILRIKPKKRTKPQCLLIEQIIKYLWEDVLSEPVNPVSVVKGIRRKLKQNAMLKNYELRIKSILIASEKKHTLP